MLPKFRNLIRVLPKQQRFLSTEDGIYKQANLERIFDDHKVESFEKIYQNDPDKKEMIVQILKEYEFAKYNEMGRVPSKIELKDMEQILEEGRSFEKRRKLLNYFFKREMDKRAGKLRLQKLKAETNLRRADKLKDFASRGSPRTGLLDLDGDILYGLWHNNLFCRIPEGIIKSGLSDSRLRLAAMFGRKLIFDFGFEQYMDKQTSRNSVDQIQEAYGMNRFKYENPLDLWFCNFDPNSISGKFCHEKALGNLYNGSMITVKEDCFTNYFDKEQLVYLSPDAREPLNNRLHKSDDVYIIGAFNDKGNHQPISFRKAMKLGIRARRLPLDEHVPWQGASKSLCINHVTGILLEVLENGCDWRAAFLKHIPPRKIKPMEQVILEEKLRQERFKAKSRRYRFSIDDTFI